MFLLFLKSKLVKNRIYFNYMNRDELSPRLRLTHSPVSDYGSFFPYSKPVKSRLASTILQSLRKLDLMVADTKALGKI